MKPIPHLPNARSAFSLVEVTLTIGIMAFALTSILGLLPVGLATFRQAVDTSVESQIVQRVTTEASQSDFATLVDPNSGARTIRYYDDQGNKLPSAADAIYHVKVTVESPASLPSGDLSPDLARLLVDIVNNPGQKPLGVDSATGGILNEPEKGLEVSRYSILASRRQ